MKPLLRRIPGLVPAYRHASFLYRVAADRWWNDCERMNDHSHRIKEWDFEAPGEHDRHTRILDAISRYYSITGRVRALELGCADGVFTRRLAQRCTSVTACDISSVACARAAERCAEFSNVSIQQFDLERDPITNQYDWVFAMDILEFVHGRDRLARVTAKLARALGPDGLLVVSVCRLPEDLREAWWMALLPEGADAILRFMNGHSDLRLVHHELHPDNGAHIPGYIDHAIGLFKKQP